MVRRQHFRGLKVRQSKSGEHKMYFPVGLALASIVRPTQFGISETLVGILISP